MPRSFCVFSVDQWGKNGVPLAREKRTTPCSTSTVTRRTAETNARIMPPHWVHLAWCRTITFPHVGRVTHLIPFSCFDICHNFGDVLEKLRDIRTARVSASQRRTRSQRFVPRRVLLWFASRCVIVPLVDPRSLAWLNLLWFPLLKDVLCNG